MLGRPIIIKKKSPLKISSGLFFDEEWLGFERQLFAHLSVLNLQSTLELEIRNSMSKMVQFKLQSGLIDILNFLNRSLRSSLRQFLKTYAESEITAITKNLKSENFFNLSKHEVNPILTQKLKLGRKFTPFLNVIVKKELEKFEKEVCNCMSRFAWGFSKPNQPNLYINLACLFVCIQ